MLARPSAHNLRITCQTLIIGGIGAAIAEAMNAPIAVLTGPALLVSLAALGGLRTGIDDTVRNLIFLLVGVSIGSGVDASATQAMLRWPFAFAALGVMLWATLWLCGQILHRGFGLDRRSAYLAAAPGHLSFVVGLSTGLNLDTTRIVVIQSVRLLALTLSVPAIALGFGLELTGQVLPPGDPMAWTDLGLLLFAGLALGYALDKIGLPAPLLIGGMLASAFGHASDITPGVMHPWLSYAGLMTVGTLIGARFNGITRKALASSLVAGLTVTTLTVLMALAAALPVAYALGFDPTHVLIAFAPGGLETMIAMGVVLGANPGFVAAAHVTRLLFLTALLPAFVGRLKRA
ncbi:AbrB family transcriptional regulator [uncultured Tateyamaria sp.]|uniref:AbrB family transcriptional regulator n=1 Tax=uncultured Tateyamaria sp. TaxID=455651 RepID=UPI0026063C28|nr:AbrB family transcriptional regulator [uncultured Tateyamaria sp.]